MIDDREKEDSPSISVSRLAGYWGVSPATIYRAIKRGELRAVRLPSGMLRIRTRDARAFGKPAECQPPSASVPA